MIRFKSSLGVQLTVTLSIVLLFFAVVFALFTTRQVRLFGDTFAGQSVSTLRHRVEMNLADRVKVRALHYGYRFEEASENSALLAEKASSILFGGTPSKSPATPVSSPASHDSGGPVFIDGAVIAMRIPGAGGSPAAWDPGRISGLSPYLEILGHTSIPTFASYAVTTGGMLLYHSHRGSERDFSGLTMEDLKSREWFAGASPENNPSQSTVWSAIYSDPTGAGTIVTASTPIYSNGAFKGVVGIDLALDGLFDGILQGDEIPVDMEGMFWFLVDMNGVPILFPEMKQGLFGLQASEEGDKRRGFLHSSDAGVRRYARGLLSLEHGDGHVELDGDTWLISHHVMPCTNWVLGVAVPADAPFSGLEETLEKYRRATRRLGGEIVVGATLFITLALGIFYCALNERLVRPLRLLAYQARRVSEGNLEVDTVSLSGEDEMARLAASFERMIVSLKEGRDFQARTTDYLESMVRSRTREVEDKAEELHVALAELTSIFSNSMVGILLLKGGRYLSKANDRLARILGYDSAEEMEGLAMREIHLSEERYARFGTLHYEALVHGERMQVEYPLKRRDGSSVWCTLSGKAVDDSIPPDLNKGVLWVVDDITERKVAEQAILESEERFREMAELLPCIVCEVDLGYRVTYINGLGVKTFGMHPEDFMKPGIVLEVLHPDDRPRMKGRMEILLGGGEVEPTEYRMVRGDGKEMTVLFHSAPMIKNSAVVGIRASITDVTEYRAMQETLLKQRKRDLIGFLVGGIAHDFNNMMTVLMGRVELASLSLDEGSPARVHLVTMEETLERVRELMQRLIALSTHGEKGTGSVPLRDVLHRCVSKAGGEAAGISLTVSESVPVMPVDGPKMGQALEHVLTNAREAYDGEGRVLVSCACHEKGRKGDTDSMDTPYVEVVVRDEGRGIAEEHLPHIFDPYYTTKERTSRKGMGLGLAVTHAVVTGHGGTLSVDSRPGLGTTVSITLPLSRGDEQA